MLVKINIQVHALQYLRRMLDCTHTGAGFKFDKLWRMNTLP